MVGDVGGSSIELAASLSHRRAAQPVVGRREHRRRHTPTRTLRLRCEPFGQPVRAAPVGVVRRIDRQRRKPVDQQRRVDEQIVRRSIDVGEQSPVLVARLAIDLEAEFGTGRDQFGDPIGRLSTETLHRAGRVDRFGSIDSQQAHRLGARAERHPDRVSINDRLHDGNNVRCLGGICIVSSEEHAVNIRNDANEAVTMCVQTHGISRTKEAGRLGQEAVASECGLSMDATESTVCQAADSSMIGRDALSTARARARPLRPISLVSSSRRQLVVG